MCQTTPRAELELPVSREAPALAREFLRGSTCAEHHSEVVDDAVLLVSELVTNSVLHGGPPVVVAVDCDEAHPAGPGARRLPRRCRPRGTPHSGDESGRGLALVAEMSADWGVDTEEDGKHVWFVIH